MTTWHMRILSWTLKATNTYSEYIIFIALPTQITVARTRLGVTLRYVACLVRYTVTFRGLYEHSNTLKRGS